MRIVPRTVDGWTARLARTRAAFVEARGPAAARQRAAAIAAQPWKRWRGRVVVRIVCAGGHVQWVPEAVLWALIDLTAYRCPYHAHRF